MPRNSAPTLRQIYQAWIEDQIEDYKDSVSRSDLLRLADEVIEELRINSRGQYQLTEVLLCTAVDRRIFELLGLPGYRTWTSNRRGARPALPDDSRDVSERHVTRPRNDTPTLEPEPVPIC